MYGILYKSELNDLGIFSQSTFEWESKELNVVGAKNRKSSRIKYNTKIKSLTYFHEPLFFQFELNRIKILFSPSQNWTDFASLMFGNDHLSVLT